MYTRVTVLSHTLTVEPASAPQHLKVVTTTTYSIRIGWEAPKDDGGSAITGYTIDIHGVEETDWKIISLVEAVTFQYDAIGLTENAEYYLRVSAQTSAGLGKPAELDKPAKACLPYGEALDCNPVISRV